MIPWKRHKPTIQILTCMYQRPLVSELFILSVRRLQEKYSRQYHIRVHAAVSEEASAEVCRKYGITYIYTENYPVGAKWNAAINDVMQFEFDYLMFCGDDDVYSNELLNLYKPCIDKSIAYFGVNQTYMYCTHTEEALFFQYASSSSRIIGSARMLSRTLIEDVCLQIEVECLRDLLSYKKGNIIRLPVRQADYFEAISMVKRYSSLPEYSLWNPVLNKGLDLSSESFLVSQNYIPVVVPSRQALITGIKTSVNIWSFDSFRNLAVKVNKKEALSFLSQSEWEQLEKIKEYEKELKRI